MRIFVCICGCLICTTSFVISKEPFLEKRLEHGWRFQVYAEKAKGGTVKKGGIQLELVTSRFVLQSPDGASWSISEIKSHSESRKGEDGCVPIWIQSILQADNGQTGVLMGSHNGSGIHLMFNAAAQKQPSVVSIIDFKPIPLLASQIFNWGLLTPDSFYIEIPPKQRYVMELVPERNLWLMNGAFYSRADVIADANLNILPPKIHPGEPLAKIPPHPQAIDLPSDPAPAKMSAKSSAKTQMPTIEESNDRETWGILILLGAIGALAVVWHYTKKRPLEKQQ
jgi:hypothetical protein